jgi:hypothetical protein
MKFVLLFSTILLYCLNARTQNLVDKDIALISHSVSVTSEALNKLDTYSPTTNREKTLFSTNKKILDKMVNDFVYETVTASLKDDKSISLQGINGVVDSRIPYNGFGYPMPMSAKGGIKKAIKNGHSADAYLKINASIMTVMDVLASAKLSQSFKPEISISIAFLGSDGKEIAKAKGKVKAPKPIRAKDFPNKKFDKLDEDYMSLLMRQFEPLLAECIDNAVKKL